MLIGDVDFFFYSLKPDENLAGFSTKEFIFSQTIPNAAFSLRLFWKEIFVLFSRILNNPLFLLKDQRNKSQRPSTRHSFFSSWWFTEKSNAKNCSTNYSTEKRPDQSLQLWSFLVNKRGLKLRALSARWCAPPFGRI